MSDIKPLLRSAKERLAASDIQEVDAEHLFAYVLGISRMDLHNSVKLEATLKALGDFGVIEDTFAKLISRRAAHEPLQYLTGTAYFRHLEIEVGPGVLVPRPESELLVDNFVCVYLISCMCIMLVRVSDYVCILHIVMLFSCG